MYVITDSSLHMRHFTHRHARLHARAHTHSLTSTHHSIGITGCINPFIYLYVHSTSYRGLLYLILVPLETVVLDRQNFHTFFFCPGKWTIGKSYYILKSIWHLQTLRSLLCSKHTETKILSRCFRSNFLTQVSSASKVVTYFDLLIK